MNRTSQVISGSLEAAIIEQKRKDAMEESPLGKISFEPLPFIEPEDVVTNHSSKHYMKFTLAEFRERYPDLIVGTYSD